MVKNLTNVFGAAVIGTNIALYAASSNPENFSDPIREYLHDNNIDPLFMDHIHNRDIRVLHDGFFPFMMHITDTVYKLEPDADDDVITSLIGSFVFINTKYVSAIAERLQSAWENRDPQYYIADNFMIKGTPAYARFDIENYLTWIDAGNLAALNERERQALAYYVYAHEARHADQGETVELNTLERMAREIDADLFGISMAQSLYPDVEIAQLVKYKRIHDVMISSSFDEIVDHNSALAIDAYERGEVVPDAQAIQEAFDTVRPLLVAYNHALITQETMENGLSSIFGFYNRMDQYDGTALRTAQLLLEGPFFDLGRMICGHKYKIPPAFDIAYFMAQLADNHALHADKLCMTP